MKKAQDNKLVVGKQMRILRWMFGVTNMVTFRNDIIRGTTNVGEIIIQDSAAVEAKVGEMEMVMNIPEEKGNRTGGGRISSQKT